MVSSVEFVRPINSALSELKRLCAEAGAAVLGEEQVKNGFGTKLYVSAENPKAAMVLYYKPSKGLSSSIVFENIPEHMKTRLMERLAPTGISFPLPALDLAPAASRASQTGSTASISNTASSGQIATLKMNGYVGTDESGKGDYFGPLVIAGVYLDPSAERRLLAAGVCDSKMLKDHQIYGVFPVRVHEKIKVVWYTRPTWAESY